ncbi:MAG: hypothetical protein LBF27_09085 [Sphingobacterium sp.]|jgi:hypothetical protein|nr:hypothetical protein [Sphingobacterium sp.]
MCSRILTCLFIIYYFFSAIYGGPVIAQLASRGLFFRNYETIQDKRTGLELFAEEPLVLNRKLNLEFDIRFNQKAHSYFGYILRLIGNDQYNIDLVCRDFSPKFKNISIVIGDKEYPISISPEMAYSYQWKKVQIMLDLQQDQLEFSFNGQKYRYPLHLPDNLAVTVNFGMTRQSGFASTDVPPIGIRQLKVTNDTHNYYWPLNERSGEVALDQYHQARAKVSNPLWGVALSENWSELTALQVHSNSSLCFDPVHEIVYIVGNDKLLAFSSLEGTLKEIPYADGPLKLLKGNQSIFISGEGTGEGKIINLFPDQRLASTFDFKTRRWSKSYMSGETTAYWHFNKVYWPEDSSVYLFGGYGYFAYKNAIQQVALHNSNYRQLAAANDVFSPRYLAAAGASQRGIYLMGGYGSLNGKQEVNPRNYNDLLLLDMTTKKMKKLGEIDFQHPGYVLSNSLVVDEKDSLIYGLIHEKNVFNTQLQLFRCDMNAKGLQMIGKGIP